jgi:molybdenum-dependent DNA-binding transcriptional regulator ModE
MESNQVRYFLALCEEQNFSRAAKRCGVSQPSVSNAIRRLEEEFGGSLFHRSRNGAKLTALGTAVWPYLDQINECAENAKQKAANFPTGDLVSTHTTMERPIRKIFYGTAITASVLLALVLVGHKPYSATESHFKASDTVDVRALERTMDMKALPRQNIPPEAYQ